MEAKDIIGLVLSAVAVLIAVVAVVVSWRIAKKQDEQQRLLARRQHIDGICKDLVDHLTTWHDQLRAVVKSDDAQGFERYIDELEAFQATKAQIEARIGEFVKNEKFEGPLETHLVALQAFPETDRARDAVWRFQQTALVFKEPARRRVRRDVNGPWPLGGYQAEQPKTEIPDGAAVPSAVADGAVS